MIPLFTAYYDDRVVQVWPETQRCRCGAAHVLFVNRNGVTYCLSCEPDNHKEVLP